MLLRPVEIPDDAGAILSSTNEDAVWLTQLQTSDSVGVCKKTQLMIKHLQVQLLAGNTCRNIWHCLL